jgi:hypothetical protein
MNLVNISKALHRLAKMTGTNPDQVAMLQLHPLVVRLLGEVSTALVTADVEVSAPRCQALSNITWALATMGIVDKPLLRMVANLAEMSIVDFKPFELATLLWAFAKLGAADAAVREWSEPLFQVSGDHILQQADRFNFRCHVMIVWAFATARNKSTRLFGDIARRMVPRMHTASCQELANTAWSFSTVGVYEEGLFSELASSALLMLSEFKPQELSILLWSFAAIGFVHEDFFDNAALVASKTDLQAQHLANVLWAHSRVRPRHRTTQAVLLALLPRCMQVIESFKPQEISSVALAAAKCFGPHGVQLPSSKAPSADLFVLPSQARDFFVSALPWVMQHLSEFSGQSLANITSAYVAVQIGGDAGFFQAIGREVLRRVGALEASALLVLLRSLPGAPQGMWVHGAIRMLLAEAANRVDTLLPNEAQVLSKICTDLQGAQSNGGGGVSYGDLRNSCQALAESGAWATAVLSDAWDEAFDMPAERVGDKSSDPVRQGDDAVVSVEASAEENSEKDGIFASDASTADEDDGGAENFDRAVKQHGFSAGGMILAVKNTFIDRVIDETDTDSTESDSEVLAKPLPPPLDIIPADVSREQLAAYRTNYQRFRAGCVAGAKSEVSMSISGLESYW